MQTIASSQQPDAPAPAPTPIERAIIAAGGTQTKLAEGLGVKQQSISVWLQQGWVPPDRALQIEQRYGVPRRELVSPRYRALLS